MARFHLQAVRALKQDALVCIVIALVLAPRRISAINVKLAFNDSSSVRYSRYAVHIRDVKAECSSECHHPACEEGHSSNGGKPLTASVCTHSCSRPFNGQRYCGAGAEYQSGESIDCSPCKVDEEAPAEKEAEDKDKEKKEPTWQAAKDVTDIADMPEGGRIDVTGTRSSSSSKDLWSKDMGGGPLSFCMAAVFVVMIGSLPVVLGMKDKNGVTNTQQFESAVLYVWLLGGLYLFTQKLIFQSVHFGGELRSLSLEEAVYLFAQIITTVGYGDITPAKQSSQVFVGAFVFLAIMLIANMVQSITTIFKKHMEDVLEAHQLINIEDEEELVKMTDQERMKAASKPLLYSFLVYVIFVIIGLLFWHNYPGEGKTIGQGVYMGLITLSSVGFGVFTPTTHGGMVFGAFWMLFGVISLGAVVSTYTAFSVSCKQYQLNKQKRKRGSPEVEIRRPSRALGGAAKFSPR